MGEQRLIDVVIEAAADRDTPALRAWEALSDAYAELQREGKITAKALTSIRSAGDHVLLLANREGHKVVDDVRRLVEGADRG